jgi:hypothetical protein
MRLCVCVVKCLFWPDAVLLGSWNRIFKCHKGKFNSVSVNPVALVHEPTIPTERSPLVGEVSTNFCGWRVSRGQCDGSLRSYFRLSRPGPLLFLPSSSLIVFTRLSGPRSRPTTFQKMCQCRESIPVLWICSQELWPLDHRGGGPLSVQL